MSPKPVFLKRKPYIKRILGEHLPKNRSLSVLDLGCGSGDWLVVLKELGFSNLTAIERDSERAAEAKNRTDARIVKESVQNFLSETDQKFDVILAIDILEHLPPEECELIIKTCFYRLNPGGIFLGRVPNANGIFGMSVRYGDLEHTQAFTPERFENMLKRSGFVSAAVLADPPIVYSVSSFVRRLTWEFGTFIFRILWMAETGLTSVILTRNFLFCAMRQ